MSAATSESDVFPTPPPPHPPFPGVFPVHPIFPRDLAVVRAPGGSVAAPPRVPPFRWGVAAGAVVVLLVGVIGWSRPDTATSQEIQPGMCVLKPSAGATEFELADCGDEHFAEVAGLAIGTSTADRCASIGASYLGARPHPKVEAVASSTANLGTAASSSEPDVICLVVAAGRSPLRAPVGPVH